jgi:hypothetical protein
MLVEDHQVEWFRDPLQEREGHMVKVTRPVKGDGWIDKPMLPVKPLPEPIETPE